ncbi:MAG: DUF4439 domain-containing protein [Mycobacterium sp.]|nr:DUF4439 domain-containing protein [Mycobacterium sp.]
MTSPSPSPSPTPAPTPDPNRPAAADQAALYDAMVTEHATIYGYGMVSAHSLPTRNELISEALAVHRERREQTLALLTERGVTVPLPADGYALPMVVDSPTDAAKLAVRMENDCAVAWRAVLEQAAEGAGGEKDRALGLAALTQCAVFAARWRRVLSAWPVTEAFPGGSE